MPPYTPGDDAVDRVWCISHTDDSFIEDGRRVARNPGGHDFAIEQFALNCSRYCESRNSSDIQPKKRVKVHLLFTIHVISNVAQNV